MAEKDNKSTAPNAARPVPPTATRPTGTTAQPAARPAAPNAARPAATATRPTGATAQPAARPAAPNTARPAATATRPTGTTAQPAARPVPPTAAKPQSAATAKPKSVTESATAAKPAATAKPVSAASTKTATKSEKSKKKNSGSKSSVKDKVAAVVKTRNFKIIGAIVLSLILVLCITLGITCGVKSCNSDDGAPAVTAVENSHRNKTQVGFSSEVIGTVQRNKPVEGMHAAEFSKGTYPTYGSTLNLTTEQKTELIQLNRKLTANGTWVDSSKRTTGSYDKMDKDGYLYKADGTKPGNGVPERLYKHTASVGLYGGNVADDEPAVVKRLTFRPRSYGSYYSVTGLYAPAGEVIKIEMTDADMTATGGLTIHIGQALYNGQANNIWEQRGFNRMPVILNTMNITKETATYDEATGLWTGYVGSFLGGPIYVRSESATFSVTVSGGVHYAHFILGVTTREEYAVYAKSSAPYFDLEVWDRGVLHSGPKRAAQKFGYDDLYKAAVLWEKIALVTTSVSNQGIVFLYDPFVAAGAAVAFPGRRSVNCPEGWMAGSLNYAGFVTSGSWGNMHEYHHNFQDYGLGSGADGEVTNNGLNLVSYSLFTKISAARTIEAFGGAGLSGWNQYTSASWALNRVNNGAIESTNGLAVYATLMHNLGQDQFIKARGARGVNSYFNKWASNTHQDFTYYAGLVNSYGGGNYSPSDAVKSANYPLFVPVSSVYQTGRTYNYDGEKREIHTMQPYVIPYGKPFTVDLNPYTVESGQYRSGSVVIAKDFTYRIKNVKADGINGTFKETDAGIYTFTPDSELCSGKIYVTLEVVTKNGAHEWNGHKLDDVDLILEFQQSHESSKNVLERTTYYYTAETAYTDAQEAYGKGYAGYESKNDRDHSNPTQNCNTDIWYCTESSISRFPKADPELAIVKPYSIDEIRGKLYFPEAGTYNIYLRGRRNCAVYYSTDGGKTYRLGTAIADDSTSANWRTDTFFTLKLEAESWVYFKEVLINEKISDTMTSFIGLGLGQWTVPMYTTEVKYYTEESGTRKDLLQETVDGAAKYYYNQGSNKVYVETESVKSEIVYKNGSGQVVSAQEAANTDLVAPTSINYATAYRQSYEFQKEFESDYFYTRTYGYDYRDNVWQNQSQTLVAEACKYSPPPAGWGWGNFPIANLVDGNKNTFIHTSGAVSESAPLILTVDMGEVKSVNRMILYSQNRPNGDWKVAKSFTLQGSLDGVEFFTVGEFVDVPRDGSTVTVNFDVKEFRYYKLTVTASYNNHIIIGEIEMWNVNEVNGATMYSPDDDRFTYRGDWQIAQTNSDFGHVYIGKSGSEISFEYEAKDDNGRFGILSSAKYGQNYEVYIDGNKVDTEKLKADSGDISLTYLTPKLSKGKHKVTVKCTGEANIDSIVLY